ncbi:hypothetical protein [Corynebacterium aquilae]|uniref:hypothetical protein n=1 Tax=Corynebacterium aquilae TaxID=203263 RepID=UPI000951EE80|nr:hypothetical protein [Corynebacterium aquilae]
MTNPYTNDPAENAQPADNSYGTAYPAAGYPGTGYGTEPFGEPQKNTVAVWALVLGIASLVLGVTAVIAVILGIIGLILGIKGLKKAKTIVGPFQRKGMAIGGLVLSILGLLAGLAFTAFYAFGLWIASDAVEACGQPPAAEQGSPEMQAYQSCVEQHAQNRFG